MVMLIGDGDLVPACLWQQHKINVIQHLEIKKKVNNDQKKLSSYSSVETKTRSPWSTRKQQALQDFESMLTAST